MENIRLDEVGVGTSFRFATRYVERFNFSIGKNKKNERVARLLLHIIS
mgnify:CR=1 FL=1